MSDDHAADISRHIRTYMIVFSALTVLTVVTVGVYYLHLAVGAAIVLALIIATGKAALVACYFMHLLTEKKLIYWVLLLTAAFFVVLLFAPFLTSVTGRVEI
jgi:cytochrome c oxidase subunit 4